MTEMVPLQPTYIAPDPQYDLCLPLYNNTSNLHLCHQDLYPILAHPSIMHTLHCSRTHNSKRWWYTKYSNSINYKQRLITTVLKMFSSLTRSSVIVCTL